MTGLQHVHLETVGVARPAPATRPDAMIIMCHHPLFRDAVGRIASELLESIAIKEAGSFSELTDMLETGSEADCIVYDLGTERECCFAGLLYLRAKHQDIPIVILSEDDDAAIVQRCLAFGVSAFIPKTASAGDLAAALRTVVDGGTWLPADVSLEEIDVDQSDPLVERLMQLTCQEIRVLILLCEGLFNKQIAFALGIAEATVKAHVSKILGKLQVYSRTQAVIAVTKIEPSGAGTALAA